MIQSGICIDPLYNSCTQLSVLLARHCRVGEKTVDVRDTAEMHIYKCWSECVLTTHLSIASGMDPRRVRDPRLARADPRLQQQQPRQQLPTLNNGVTSNPGSHSVTPPQPFVNAVATMSSQIPPATDMSVPTLTQPQNTHVAPSFKTRPLFCVVCASNQVSHPDISFTQLLKQFTLRIDPWKVILSYCT